MQRVSERTIARLHFHIHTLLFAVLAHILGFQAINRAFEARDGQTTESILSVILSSLKSREPQALENDSV